MSRDSVIDVVFLAVATGALLYAWQKSRAPAPDAPEDFTYAPGDVSSGGLTAIGGDQYNVVGLDGGYMPYLPDANAEIDRLAGRASNGIVNTAESVWGYLLTGQAYTSGNMPRGIRNNNPGNIEFSSANPWVGQIGADERYARFDTMANGVRALAKLLGNYRSRYGLNTIRGIISRWAPPTENDTDAYILKVSRRVNEPADAVLDWSRETRADLIDAIITQENGFNPVSRETILNGIDLADGYTLA